MTRYHSKSKSDRRTTTVHMLKLLASNHRDIDRTSLAMIYAYRCGRQCLKSTPKCIRFVAPRMHIILVHACTMHSSIQIDRHESIQHILSHSVVRWVINSKIFYLKLDFDFSPFFQFFSRLFYNVCLRQFLKEKIKVEEHVQTIF